MTEQVKTSQFSFEGYIIDKSIIEVAQGDISKTKKFGFKSKGTIDNTQKLFILELLTQVSDENELMKIAVNIIAKFRFTSEIAPEILDNLFYKNAPAIVFPYIRAYVSSLTALSGIETIILPTINMESIAEELKENTNLI